MAIDSIPAGVQFIVSLMLIRFLNPQILCVVFFSEWSTARDPLLACSCLDTVKSQWQAARRRQYSPTVCRDVTGSYANTHSSMKLLQWSPDSFKGIFHLQYSGGYEYCICITFFLILTVLPQSYCTFIKMQCNKLMAWQMQCKSDYSFTIKIQFSMSFHELKRIPHFKSIKTFIYP